MTGGMMFKGTPGPWYVGDNGKEGPKPRYWIVTNEETWCYRVCSVPEYNEAKAFANARLIAAAPELLNVLIRIESVMDFDGTCHPFFRGLQDQMKSAIAKALGEQK